MERIRSPRTPDPFLAPQERMNSIRMRELIIELRLAAGQELRVRSYPDSKAAPVKASNLRRQLGTDFYVRADPSTGDVFARCRLRGEPEVKGRRIRTGTKFMTLEQAAGTLGISQDWLRQRFLGTEELIRYQFDARVVVRRDQVDALSDTIMSPMGVWAGDRGTVDPSAPAPAEPSFG